MFSDARRRHGAQAMVAGVVCGLIGRLVDVTWAEYLFGGLAVLLLVIGGIVVANTYREESGRAPRGSRAELAAHQVSSGLRTRRSRKDASLAHAPAAPLASTTAGPSAAGADEATAGLDGDARRYLVELSGAMQACEALLERSSPEATPAELASARDQLMRLVASPRYGAALHRGALDEAALRSLSERLASRLA